ncbi:hypothetical protein K431DRAFT_301229 [Polychaeton citri CBS 116435]|uniref:Phosphoglycerate mutase-like protein n=1 Tax=Polychaeton citri CBS 116435 TaxID=1314669 RepID=A0A9P4QBF9_9PEZI|nr:hypothetical protein K431DRAFT_301229 [Polychaeton citri CBS 116435]
MSGTGLKTLAQAHSDTSPSPLSFELILCRHGNTEEHDLTKWGLGVAQCDCMTGMMYADIFCTEVEEDDGNASEDHDVPPASKVIEPLGIRHYLTLWVYQVRVLDIGKIRAKGVPAELVTAMERYVVTAGRWLAEIASPIYQHGYMYSRFVEGMPALYFSDRSEKQWIEMAHAWKTHRSFANIPLLNRDGVESLGLIQRTRVVFSAGVDELGIFFDHGGLQQIEGEETQDGNFVTALYTVSPRKQKKREYQKRRKAKKVS